MDFASTLSLPFSVESHLLAAPLLSNANISLVVLMVAVLCTLLYFLIGALRRLPSCPSTDSFLFGSAWNVFYHWDDLYDWATEQTFKFGGATWFFTLPFKPSFVVISTPELCEHVLKTNFDNYEKGEVFHQNFHDFLGDGIFNVDGQKWKMQRRRSSHMFSVNSFKNHMLECFVKHGEVLLSVLKDVPEGGVIDMNSVFMRYTLDSIGEIGFGYEIGSLKNPSHIFAQSFDYIQNLANLRFFLLHPLRYFNPMEYQAATHITELSAIAKDCIAQHKAALLSDSEQKTDFLAIFMNGEEKCSDAFYQDLIMNFTIAGRDTTGLALSWMFWLLSQHPEKEQKLIEEIEREVGDEPITYDAMNRLKYADACFSETLRLYPSVPKDGKVAIKDDVLPDGTVIPAGTLVAYFPYVMGRREDLWEKANEFIPERFMEQPKPSPFKFIAFQAGPRTCLGQRMAYLEAKVITTMILKQFRLRTRKGFTPKYSINLTLSMKNGLEMTVHNSNQ